MKNFMILFWTLGLVLAFGSADGQTCNTFPECGNVSIGTTVSGSKLTVGTQTSRSPSSVAQLGGSTASGESMALSLVNAGGGSNQSTSIGFHNRSNWSPTGKIQTQQVDSSTESKLHFYTYRRGLKNRMTIDQLGNVGIGTTTPNQKLSVVGTIRAAYNKNETEYTEISHGGVNGFINTVGDGNLDFRHDGSTKMSLTSDGTVGIGTSNPKGFLHIYERSGAGATLYLDAAPNANPNIVFATDGITQANIRVNDGGNNALQFQVGANTPYEMNILPNGNVGIGTTTPSNKLDVNGTIRAKEILVEEGWGDYVFYEDYDLPTLEEEAQHIQAKGHLSGFESAEEMNGQIELGNVTHRQQVKIEEMMLHLIEMKQEIQQLKEENIKLNEELNNLK